MLNTDRLIIRELYLEDVPDVHQLHSFPETDQFNTLGIPENLSVTTELVEKWIEDQSEPATFERLNRFHQGSNLPQNDLIFEKNGT